MADVQVKTELTLDDKASNVMDGIQREFDETDKSVENTQSAVKQFGIQFASTFAALNLKPLLSGMGDVISEFITVGSAAYDAEQGIAGMLAGMSGTEWGLARAYAEDLNAEFNDLSANIGQAKDDIQAGHKALTIFLGGTSQAMKVASDNMETLTTIANVQGIAVSELGAQFGKMASGFVATESPVFNLLRSTGIFADNIADINKEWQALTKAERIEKLEGAFANIATNLKDAPPTLSDMVTSVSAIGDEFMETFGKSAMKGFMGSFDDLRGDLRDSRSDMRSIAQDFGKDIGVFAGDAIGAMKEGFQYIKTHSDEIREAVKDGFKFARETVKWIIDHKTELIAIGGALAVSRTGLGGSLLSGAAGFGAAAVGGISGMLGERDMARSMGMMGTQPATPAFPSKLQTPTINVPPVKVPPIKVPPVKIPPIKVPTPIVNMPAPTIGAAPGMVGANMMGSANATKTLLQQDAAMRRAMSTMTSAQRDVIRQMSASRSVAGKLASSLKGFAASGNMGVQAGAKLAGMLGRLFSTIAAGGPVVWAATAAIAGLAAGAYALNRKLEEAEEERQETIKNNVSEYEQITSTIGRLSEAQLKQLDKLRSEAAKAGADSGERTFEKFDVLDKQRRELMKQYVTPMEEARIAVERVGGMIAEGGEDISSEMYEKFAAGEKTIIEGIDTMFNRAHKAHAEGVEKYMLTTLNKSQELKTSFLMASNMTAEGFGHLAELASTMGEDFAQLTSQLRVKQERALNEAVVQAKPQVHFNGGQVFKIQQNFRNENPDRVVVAFEKRFTQAAVSRVQAATTTPFGT